MSRREGDGHSMQGKPLEAEPFEPDESLPQDLRAMRRFARLLDQAVAIPGTTQRVGLDSAIGLVPGVGDAFAALLSVTFLASAWRHRVPARILAKMTFNIVVDLLIGTIPVVGDLFDIAFKDNIRNVELLIRWRDRTRAPRGGREFLVLLACIAIVVAAAVAVLAGMIILVVGWIMRSLP